MQYQVPTQVSNWFDMDMLGLYKYPGIIDGSHNIAEANEPLIECESLVECGKAMKT